MGKQWKQCQTLFFLSSKITADVDCSHEIKRRLLLGRKVMTNLDSMCKSRDITLPTQVHLVGDAIQPSHPLVPFSSCPQPPSIRVFSNESILHMRWPKYWSFSFSIIPSKEHLGLISFRMDWLDLPAVQRTLKSLLQHHTSKHQFFGTQLSSQSNSHIHT